MRRPRGGGVEPKARPASTQCCMRGVHAMHSCFRKRVRSLPSGHRHPPWYRDDPVPSVEAPTGVRPRKTRRAGSYCAVPCKAQSEPAALQCRTLGRERPEIEHEKPRRREFGGQLRRGLVSPCRGMTVTSQTLPNRHRRCEVPCPPLSTTGGPESRTITRPSEGCRSFRQAPSSCPRSRPKGPLKFDTADAAPGSWCAGQHRSGPEGGKEKCRR